MDDAEVLLLLLYHHPCLRFRGALTRENYLLVVRKLD